ncbi:uncharacterized protein BJ212DRAFT_1291839 [Suillus subaureus]|uniref:Uncharacterized protein n=1 Tax=Suillus subaureus TaxID=48587 RepID=A0A9P7ASS5_9AGAM|nr:uncharacterized protein BJ212DRAFT_1291839 [Suillus subaureus]KAG1794723.1 hypothetical protein BJ212DRAFT_1291839 [Suillus subaureus]
MACIASDPVLDIQPDFSSPTFEGLRNCIIGGTQMTHEEVTNKLATAWEQDCNLRVVAWTRQVDKDQCLAAHAAQTEWEQVDQERLCLEQEAEAELCEAEKKKPKINDFKIGAAIGNTLTPHPSQYMIHKLKSFKYIELWYFSPDGCRETANDAKTSADNTFSLTKVEDFVALKPVTSFKASRKAIQDHNLEWCQFDLTKNSFLLYINKLKWPDKHQQALTMFFMNIVSHPSCSEPYRERALLLYAARVHHNWHNTLVLDNAFDISVFNLTLLKNMGKEVWNKVCQETLVEVSLSPFTTQQNHNS